MMTKRTSKELFDLVKGMNKTEKRQFYLMASRNSTSEDLQILAVYKALNKMKQYDSGELARTARNIEKRKLPGLKNSLYQLLLESLRLHKGNVNLQLNQLLDYATVLYQRGFYDQALKAIGRMKQEARRYHQVNFLLQALLLEKKILILDDCDLTRIQALNNEMENYTRELQTTGELSNCGMLLYGYYARYGRSNEAMLDTLYEKCLAIPHASFYAELYFRQAGTYYFLLKEKKEEAYAEVIAWVNLFKTFPEMKNAEALQYQRALYFLSEIKLHLPEVVTAPVTGDLFYTLAIHLNISIAFNRYDDTLLDEVASFTRGLPEAEQKILLCYKSTVLCVACGNNSRANDFILAALANKNSYRVDLQDLLRQIQIRMHEELENFELATSLDRSRKRFIRSRQLQILSDVQLINNI